MVLNGFLRAGEREPLAVNRFSKFYKLCDDAFMPITYLQCHSFRGKAATADKSSFLAFNPAQMPGSLVMAGARAVKDSIGSQVACRLSLEHFTGGVLNFFEEQPAQSSADNSRDISDESPKSLAVLEAAFRNANTSVYSFGHKLAAGGRMAASLIGLVLEDRVIAAGRVGGGSAYLYRGGELFPFFEKQKDKEEHKAGDDFVGANSLVSVELASVPVEAQDVLIVFSNYLTPDEEDALSVISHELFSEQNFAKPGNNPCQKLVKLLFTEPENVPFVLLTQVGPETIYLADAVAVG